jgi:chemotaxis protein CheX
MTSVASVVEDTISKHWECMTAATSSLFESTCGIGIQPEPCPVAKKENLMLSVIALVGDLEWSIFLGLPGPTATALAAKFAGFEIPFESADMGDAIGELTNILAGKVKSLLNDRGVKVDISLPTVLRADSLEVLVQHRTAMAKACFVSPVGNLWAGVVSGKSAGLMV